MTEEIHGEALDKMKDSMGGNAFVLDIMVKSIKLLETNSNQVHCDLFFLSSNNYCTTQQRLSFYKCSEKKR